jgi:hypothetical protein
MKVHNPMPAHNQIHTNKSALLVQQIRDRILNDYQNNRGMTVVRLMLITL